MIAEHMPHKTLSPLQTMAVESAVPFKEAVPLQHQGLEEKLVADVCG